MADTKQFVFVERNRALTVAATCGIGVITEEAELQGYQIYIVEQWICDRITPSNTVKVFTGDPAHKIKVCVLAIAMADLEHPRPEIQPFFSNDMPLKMKSTSLGEITLTDPSELPYDMDMVLVPDGDFDGWIKQAYINIDLRRVNCTGRSALNLKRPNPASEEKFRSLYKISEAVDFEDTVINLVILAQISLYLFKLLKRDYIDGLLCNDTLRAFREFYMKYQPHKSTEYQMREFWMEPHLLTALITKIIVCRNKLQAYGFTTIKDPFADFEALRFDIEEFQRVKGLKKTRLIDLETLEKLNEYTPGQLKVRKVLKSKLDDISESSDPEAFRRHFSIESLRTIWRPRIKSVFSGDMNRQPNEIIHIIKGVSGRSAKTNGAASELLTKVAGSLPWTLTTDSKQPKIGRTAVTQGKPSTGAATIPSHISVNIPMATGLSRQLLRSSTAQTVPLPNAWEEAETRPFTYKKTSRESIDSPFSSDEDIYVDRMKSLHMYPMYNNKSRRSTDETQSVHNFLDQGNYDLPSFVRAQTSFLTPLDGAISSVVTSPSLHGAPRGNATHLMAPAQKHRMRASSDSIAHTTDPRLCPSSSAITATFSLSPLSSNHRRSSSVPTYFHAIERPCIAMDIRTYMSYERLSQQHAALQQVYRRLQTMASDYERTAGQLRSTYQRRMMVFDHAQRAVQSAIDDQQATEWRVKAMEEDSAKLYYELNVVNDYLKDMQENVSTFYGKIGLLERKMEDSQSINTLFIIGNYFRHYWEKSFYGATDGRRFEHADFGGHEETYFS
ncbi:hypothetical protein BDF14DRAFT_1880247 [Spinellus fusiger]|nr:hypothetical protein BDF14DRAFT_1880247 [Spinellus fusiger]